MKIIISPYSSKLKNGLQNPKNYPYFNEVIKELKKEGIYTIQIGVDGEEKFKEANEYQFNLNLKDLERLTLSVDTFISVDNFYPHLCNLINKKGIVIFSQSDPLIFGHSLHINLLKDRSYLRENQFWLWEQCSYNYEAFINPIIVKKAIESILKNE